MSEVFRRVGRAEPGTSVRHLPIAVAAVLAIGLGIRLFIAWKCVPTGDNRVFAAAADDLRRHGFSFYGYSETVDGNYPYPPAYLPVFLMAQHLSGAGVATFWQAARVVPILADLALAWIVQAHLSTERTWFRALAALAIALGPSFVASSAVEAQIDAVAILPTVVAVLLWQKNVTHRALYCGLLVGLGAAIKTIPLILILALLPTVISRKEAVRLVAATAVIPALALAPFALADWNGTISALRYVGYPGAGGLSLVVQPSLAGHYNGDGDLSSAYPLLLQWGWLLTVIGLSVTALLLYRSRLAALPAAAVLMLVLYATSMNWYPQYLAWGFPFFLLCGYVLPVVISELVVTWPILFNYRPQLGGRISTPSYVLVMDALWLAAAASAAVVVRRLYRAPRQAPVRPSDGASAVLAVSGSRAAEEKRGIDRDEGP
jgi:hypothetical protein